MASLCVSGPGCARSTRKTSFISPVVDPVSILTQLMVDLRTSKTITWKSHVVIYDQKVPQDTLTNLINELRTQGFITLMDLGDPARVTARSIQEVFAGARPYDLGNKFVSLVSKEVVPALKNAVR